MQIRILNLNNNNLYNYDVDETTTMKNIKEQYAQQLNLNIDNFRVWISFDKCPTLKKEWTSDFDYLTLASCNVLKPAAQAFIIIKSV
jgi:hypothetical protein